MSFVRFIRNTVRENKLLLFALLLLIGASFKINFMDFPVMDFSDTVLSMASSKNIDMGNLIKWYYFYAIPLCFLFAYALLKSNLLTCWKSKCRLNIQNLPEPKFIEEHRDFLFVLLALFCNVIGGKRDWISIFINIAIALFLFLSWKYKNQDIICRLAVGIKVFVAFCIPIFFMGLYIGWKVSLFLSFAVLIGGYYFYLTKRIFLSTKITKIINEIHIFLWAAAFDALLLYIYEILLLRGYNVNIHWLLIPYIVAGIYCWWAIKNKECTVAGKWIYPILFILCVVVIPVLGREIQIDFFEGANHGLSIQEFIYGWGVPVFSNLDAHLLSNTVGGLLYWELTKDYEGALFAPYSDVISNFAGILSLSFILGEHFNKEKVLILLFLVPWGIFKLIYPGLIAIVAFLWWKKQNNWISDLLIILLFILLCFYRIDIGVSFGGALIILPFLYNLFHHNYKRIIQYTISGMILAGISLLGCYSIAQYVHVDFLHLIESFITAFSSNQNWGYGDLGKKKYVYWFYFIQPVVITTFVYSYLYKIKNYYKNNSIWIILFFYFAYLLNWPRALVRHTMAEQAAATYAIPIILSFFIMLLVYEENKEYLERLLFVGLRRISMLSLGVKLTTVLGGGILLTFIFMLPHRNLSAVSQFPNLYYAMDSIYQQEHALYKFNEGDQMQTRELKKFFDTYLHANETYFDFSNQSLFFAFTNRENPIYINQCPGMINGKKGQLQALQEIKKKDVRFVLMPYKTRNKGYYGAYMELDGILNTDRYYILFEYIMQNYRPFCRVGDFAIWCKREDYAELLEKDKSIYTDREYLTYMYGSEQMHQHNLGTIPYLWGQFASGEDEKGKYISIQNNEVCWNIPGGSIGKSGFIVLTLQADEQSVAKVNLSGESGRNISYTFNVMKGIGQYRLRVSSDMLWYSDLINKMTINANGVMVKSTAFQGTEESI